MKNSHENTKVENSSKTFKTKVDPTAKEKLDKKESSRREEEEDSMVE